ncbi:ABC transporter permease [Macrococcoides caseolyticum]|uniref:ABC transmembrane type-1 domain-containing protein n=1 Tax=Macrococcus caseolyticus (strain JCSC5402) TaxID=458233 RepID=B9EBH7_MACCJ|nr:ABC transporter permease [Macrococcus caseolyticus]ARQ04337.1 Putative aliphatic sulfonates transport permease protein SsuC [Macrococcus caseolyticus]PKD98601.1 ABC transporter permease [Macrococcus caseolyticus]PKE34690.1 ABC transporter permease [Macrococcus caseolyticus]PKE45295.1 ABC transporter permease [Macrococcus caseolyticus]PKE63895.1 ABC transporter permease [Macrococcus caseolyticus]
MMKYVKFFLFFIILLCIWEVLVRLLHVDAYTLPAPSAIFKSFFNDFSTYHVHLYPTLLLVVLGIICSILCGICVAIILRLIPGLHEYIYPLLIMSQNVPVIVIAPLLVIWFGFGILPKLIVITLVCFFPITVSLLEGFNETDKELEKYMKMMGATRLERFKKLEWPNSMTYFFNGLKIAGTYSVMGAIISEWLGSDKGLGKFMLIAQRAFQVDQVFVAIVWIIIFAMVIYFVIYIIQRIVLRWQR